jgi:hypothetical protein
MDIALQRGDYAITTDPSRLDVPAIHAFLSESYWSQGIPLALVQRAIDHSLCFGLYHRDAHGPYRQFGFSDLAMPTRMMEILDIEVYTRAAAPQTPA